MQMIAFLDYDSILALRIVNREMSTVARTSRRSAASAHFWEEYLTKLCGDINYPNIQIGLRCQPASNFLPGEYLLRQLLRLKSRCKRCGDDVSVLTAKTSTCTIHTGRNVCNIRIPSFLTSAQPQVAAEPGKQVELWSCCGIRVTTTTKTAATARCVAHASGHDVELPCLIDRNLSSLAWCAKQVEKGQFWCPTPSLVSRLALQASFSGLQPVSNPLNFKHFPIGTSHHSSIAET